MSFVSGVTLQMSCAEDYEEQDIGPDKVPLVDKVNEWLGNRGLKPLAAVEKYFGGTKHPQILVYGAGFNYFPHDEFAAFVMSLPWRLPEDVVLLINPEDGPTKVFRPKY